MIVKNCDLSKKYTFGCVLTVFNRKDVLYKTLNSINCSFIPDDFLLVVVDDCSDDIFDFDIKCDHIIIKKEKNYGVANSLAIGWDLLFFLKIPFLLNLDSDVVVSENWLSRLFFVYNNFIKLNRTNCILTGFNGKNHRVVKQYDDFVIKRSIGGLNLFFSISTYPTVRKSLTSYGVYPSSIEKIIKDISLYANNKPIISKHLNKIMYSRGPDAKDCMNGWDWSLVSLCYMTGISMVCTNPSVVEHVGDGGSHKLSNKFEKSCDFKHENLVPKIIHQTWKTKNLPPHFELMQQSVIQNNQDFEYKFWTDEDIESFVRNTYPEYWDFYNSYDYIIQQIDFFRLLALHHFGGIYIDIDTLCFCNLSCVTKHPVTLIKTKKHPMFHDYDFVLNNAFIASERKSLFIEQCINNCLSFDVKQVRFMKKVTKAYRKVYLSAGPLMVTNTYKNFKYKNFVNILDDNFYHGYSKSNTENTLSLIEEKKDYFSNNYSMVHIHESSWWLDEDKNIKLPDLNKRYFNL